MCRRPWRTLALLATLVVPSAGKAQGIASPGAPPEFTAAGVARDAGALLRSTIRPQRKSAYLAAATIATATALAAFWDDDIDGRARSTTSRGAWSPLNRLAGLGRWYGHDDARPVIAMGGLAAAFFVAGKITDNSHATRTAAQIVESWTFAAGAVYGVKLLTGRARPDTGDGPHRWVGPGRHAGARRSFPSGHTATAFTLATLISHRYPRWWVRVAAYSLSAAIAAQRIDDGRHWASDVVVGGGIGIAVGSFVASRHHANQEDSR